MTSTDHAHSTVSVEQTLQPIPEDVRTHRVSGQFWIWSGANIAPINWVLGRPRHQPRPRPSRTP